MFGKKLKTETDETVSKVNKDASEELESSKNRKLTDRVKKFVMVAFLVMAGYHLYALYLGLFVSQIHNAWHLLFVTSLIFLTKRAFIYESESVIPIRDIIFAILGVIAFGYVIIEYNDLIQRAVAPNNMDIMMGLLAIALILEACRRCYGIVLPLIAIIFLLYAYFGNYIPGILHYRGATISKIIFIEYMQTSGIFGTITKTSATIILMFTMFGGFLLVSGGGSTVVNLAYALAGRFTGGQQKWLFSPVPYLVQFQVVQLLM